MIWNYFDKLKFENDRKGNWIVKNENNGIDVNETIEESDDDSDDYFDCILKRYNNIINKEKIKILSNDNFPIVEYFHWIVQKIKNDINVKNPFIDWELDKIQDYYI